MKILHVSLWPIDRKSIGGTEKYVVCLSSALKKLSIDNEVIMLSGKRIIINDVLYIPINLSSINKFDEYSIKGTFFQKFSRESLKKFAKKIESNFDFSKYDIIHFNSLLFYFCAFNKRRVFTIHINQVGFEQNWGKNSFDIISGMIKNDNNSKTTFIVPSKYYADKYRKKFKKEVIAIPHSLPESFLKEKKTGKKHDKKWLKIFVPSRLEIKQKGQDLLLKSLNNIKDKLPKFRIIFSGIDNQYKPNIKTLKNMAKIYGIPLSFEKLRMDEMKNAYNRADLVVLPSRYESFGYAAIESLSFGKKTVLSNIPTHREIALGNKFAFIAEKNNPISLGKIILKAVNSNYYGQINKKWIDRYSNDQWINKYINFYKSCLSK